MDVSSLLSIIRNQAIRYANRRFEIDELVNAVWLTGEVQKVNNILYAAKRAEFAIIEYIRSELNGRKTDKVEFVSLDAGDETALKYTLPQGDANKAQIDMIEADYRRNLYDQAELTGRQRLIVNLLVQGYTQRQISAKIGYSQLTVSLEVKKSRKKVKKALEKENE